MSRRAARKRPARLVSLPASMAAFLLAGRCGCVSHYDVINNTRGMPRLKMRVRRARESDLDHVMTHMLASITPAGTDIVPMKWPFWFSDADSFILIGAENDSDQPVAMAVLRRLSGTGGYIAGIRIRHSAYRASIAFRRISAVCCENWLCVKI